jgi:hypothetical protein
MVSYTNFPAVIEVMFNYKLRLQRRYNTFKCCSVIVCVRERVRARRVSIE